LGGEGEAEGYGRLRKQRKQRRERMERNEGRESWREQGEKSTANNQTKHFLTTAF
jgi:hypothetical protein